MSRSLLADRLPLAQAPLATVAGFNAVLFSARGAAERVLSPDGAPAACLGTVAWQLSVCIHRAYCLHAAAAPAARRRSGLPEPSPGPLPRRPAGAPLTLGQMAVAGGFAGVPVSLLATPTELLKCRLQAQRSKPPPGAVYTAADVKAGRALYRGPGPLMRAIVQHEGPLALMRGLTATMVREVPGNAGARRSLGLALAGQAAAAAAAGATVQDGAVAADGRAAPVTLPRPCPAPLQLTLARTRA